MFFFFFQAEDGIRDTSVTGVQTCALPIYRVGPILVRRGGTAAVPHRDHDLVDARWNADELLIDHALVAALRLLEALHADGLVARELAHGARVGPEGDLHVVVRGEIGRAHV